MQKSLWIRTYGGGQIDLLNPAVKDILFTDIVWPLAKTCRYNGAIRNRRRGGVLDILHYSVAEHSVLLARKLFADHPGNPAMAMQALMHDATEAYLGDMLRPVKDLFPKFEVMEDRLLQTIFKKFNIRYPLYEAVCEYDTRITLDEQAEALNNGPGNFELDCSSLGVEPSFFSPEDAYSAFVQMYGKLQIVSNERMVFSTPLEAEQ